MAQHKFPQTWDFIGPDGPDTLTFDRVGDVKKDSRGIPWKLLAKRGNELGVASTTGTFWNGWVPRDSMTDEQKQSSMNESRAFHGK